MKKTSRILAVLLIVAMLAGMTSALALDKWQYKKYKQYMCIGDSIAAGYTVSGTWDNYGWERVPGAYHDIVANAVDANLLQYGMSAFRMIELRYILTGVETDPDEYWKNIFGDYYTSPEVLDASFTKSYIEGFKTSDLVTINLGSNDILTPALNQFLGIMNGTDMDCDGITDPEPDPASQQQFNLVTRFIEQVNQVNPTLAGLLGMAKNAPPALQQLISTLWQYYNLFKTNWEASMPEIYKLNPEVTLAVLGVFNPANHVYIDENNTINLAPIVQPVINAINRFLKTESSYAKKYVFVDVDGIETWDITLSDPGFGSYFVWACHPNRVGHVQMAGRILEALPEHEVPIYFRSDPADVTVNEGEQATFSVTTNGNRPLYQWQTAPKGSDQWTNIGEASYEFDAATLTVDATADMDGNQYRCVVIDWYGTRGEPATSESATLTVIPAKTEPAQDDPTTEPTKEDPKTEPTKTEPTTTEPTASEPTKTEPAKAFPFTDVTKADWSYDDIYYVWEHGLMNGMTDTTFAPQGTTTRAQFATVIYRMEGSPAVTEAQKKACPFTDLVDEWYQDAVVWAYNAKVVKGVSDTAFAPNAEVTREQMVTMLYRYDGEKAAGGDLSKITDADAISEYAKPAVAWAVVNGIVNGYPDGTFRPQNNTTREQMAAIIARFDRMA